MALSHNGEPTSHIAPLLGMEPAYFSLLVLFGFLLGCLQAHETAVRTMDFTHNGNFLLSGDDSGTVRYWKPNLELVKSVQVGRCVVWR